MSNPSGIYPLLDRVLIRPDEIEETTDSGIVIPDPVKEQHQMAQATGTLIAVGPDAFVHSRVVVYNPDGSVREIRVEAYDEDGLPKPGDRVMYAKYQGLSTFGKDGLEYKQMNDRDITSRVEHDVKYTGIQARKRLGAAA